MGKGSTQRPDRAKNVDSTPTPTLLILTTIASYFDHDSQILRKLMFLRFFEGWDQFQRGEVARIMVKIRRVVDTMDSMEP